MLYWLWRFIIGAPVCIHDWQDEEVITVKRRPTYSNPIDIEYKTYIRSCSKCKVRRVQKVFPGRED